MKDQRRSEFKYLATTYIILLLTHHSRSLADELLDEFGAGDADEGAVGVMSDGASEESLPGARRAVQQHA